MQRILLSLLLLLAVQALRGAENESALYLHEADSDTVATTVQHQVMSRNVFAELFGPSFGVSLGFDSRFRPGSVLGYRVGLGVTSGSVDYSYNHEWRDLSFNGVSIPLEINAVLGSGKSKFEAGLGITAFVLRRDEWKVSGYWEWDDEGETISEPESSFWHGTRPNILGTINMAYRYQRETGFFMRVGLTAFIGAWSCSPIDGVMVLPCLSLGYTFKY